MLFIRGKVISGANIINGLVNYQTPPIMIGITRKKIIRKAWLLLVYCITGLCLVKYRAGLVLYELGVLLMCLIVQLMFLR